MKISMKISWKVPWILILFILLIGCRVSFAAHFNLKLDNYPLIPPDEFFMTIEGKFTIRGEAAEKEDEIGLFVKLPDGSWKLCGMRTSSPDAQYKANVFNYRCVKDGPKDNSLLQVRIWDASSNTEYTLDSSQLHFIISPIKNTSGQFIYKKNKNFPERCLCVGGFCQPGNYPASSR